MSEPLHKKISTWLEAELAREANRTCIRLELSSAQQGMRGNVLRSWDRQEEPSTFDPRYVEPFASELLRFASEYADSFGPGNHRFVLRTEQALGGQARMAFRVLVEAQEEDNQGGEDAPNALGLLAQQMRHNEVMMRTMLQVVGGATQTLAKRLDANEVYIGKLLEDRHKAFDELEASRGQQSEREMQQIAQVTRDARIDKGIDKAMPLLPAIVNRIVGKGTMAERESPQDMMIGAFADSLQPEQIQKIAAALEPQQQILLIELMESAKRKKAAAASAEAQAKAGSGVNGHATTTGS